MQLKVKEALHYIWMVESHDDADKAFESAIARFSTKYPKTMACLEKIVRNCWLFMIFQQSTGFISG